MQESANAVFSWVSSTASTIGGIIHQAVQEEPNREAYPDINTIDVPTNDNAPPFSYALTPTLLEFAAALSDHELTFLNFPKSNQPFQLTLEQEEHARLLLDQCKPIGQLRFRLVPMRMKEGEFWRVYFLLMRNVARKFAQHEPTGEMEAEVEHAPASTEHSDEQQTSASTSSTPFSSPQRSTIDFDAIDRLCGVNNPHGRRLSMDGAEDDPDEFDDQTDSVINEIVRRHRLSGSFSLPSPMKAVVSSQTAVDDTAGEFGVSEAELDAALLQEEEATNAAARSHHPQSASISSIPLDSTEELP